MSDHMERLETLRDQLAEALDGAREEMLPQLAGQYRATLAEIAAIHDAEPKSSMTDDLKARRDERRKAMRASAKTS